MTGGAGASYCFVAANDVCSEGEGFHVEILGKGFADLLDGSFGVILDPLPDQLLEPMLRTDVAEDELRANGFSPDNPLIKKLLYLVGQLIGFPRHLSQHVGGFVISQGKLSQLVPIENAAMAERTVIQWEKNDLEALGLLKIDVLALGMLSAIRKALHYISGYSHKPITLADIPPEDPAVYAMLQQADTIGVFQIESRILRVQHRTPTALRAIVLK